MVKLFERIKLASRYRLMLFGIKLLWERENTKIEILTLTQRRNSKRAFHLKIYRDNRKMFIPLDCSTPTLVFPEPVGPTSINPLRTSVVSYSWITFLTKSVIRIAPLIDSTKHCRIVKAPNAGIDPRIAT